MSPIRRQVPPAPQLPQPSATIDPLITVWPKDQAIIRVYDTNSPAAASSFYAGTLGRPGRFHPFTPAGKRKALPVLYGADSLEGAISETVFHDVPVRGTKIVDARKFQHRMAVTLAPTRDLRLADLTSPGLGRIGVSRLELIDSNPRSYGQTARWARAIHAYAGHFDGLLWVSRQYDRSRALVLFGDRVDPTEIPQDPLSVPLPLRIGSGLDHILTMADDARITITGLD